MEFHLVSGGCGFVGSNMVKRLKATGSTPILVVDDLSVGKHPNQWFQFEKVDQKENITVYDDQVYFIEADFRKVLAGLNESPSYLKNVYNVDVSYFKDVFHFAAIVGGRAKIDGDPMSVALDLAIDAEFFNWICKARPQRVLYPSSSAAYPIDLQAETGSVALKETDIDFAKMGQPDMTYGWSKLTGEFLAKIAAEHYGIHITCIRPFSGYGEDQDTTYPIPAIAERAAKKEDPFEVWGTGKQGRDFVHIDDVLDCTLLAMDKISDGSAINIGQGRLTSFLEIIDLFTEFAGYNPEIKCLLDKPVGVHARYCDMSFVKEKLGWEPKISIREGMRRVYDKAVKNLKG